MYSRYTSQYGVRTGNLSYGSCVVRSTWCAWYVVSLLGLAVRSLYGGEAEPFAYACGLLISSCHIRTSAQMLIYPHTPSFHYDCIEFYYNFDSISIHSFSWKVLLVGIWWVSVCILFLGSYFEVTEIVLVGFFDYVNVSCSFWHVLINTSLINWDMVCYSSLMNAIQSCFHLWRLVHLYIHHI